MFGAGSSSLIEPLAERGPGELVRFLEDKRAELATLEAQMQKAHEVAHGCEERWTEHYDEILAELEEESDKLPGEDIRLSIARRRGGGEAWKNWRRAERVVKSLEKRATLLGNQVSAGQSEAKLMRAA